jgi:NAD(P)-dependent dehydrogenase (short-subunit alcohol dehydrogenase family)
MSTPLSECVAIVTGGATGIGFATAQVLAREGCAVVIAAHDENAGKAAVEHLNRELPDDGAQASCFTTDVRSEEQVAQLIDEVHRRWGRIDLLFNNAGVEGKTGPMQGCDQEVVDAVIDTNLKGTFFGIKHTADIINRSPHGMVVNNASITGTIPMPHAMPYGASKAGIIHLTRSLAANYPDGSLRTYAICPAVVKTAMIDRVCEAFEVDDRQLAADVCPSGKVATPQEIAQLVLRLFRGEFDFPSGAALQTNSDGIELISGP